MHFRSALILSIFVFAMGVLSTPAYADGVQTMTVSEIQTGMTGIGRTVIRGTEIQDFDVEVIDVFASMGFNGGPLIMVRLSGEVIDATGGIAGGYSGSPVYIDGKLIGAVSWGPYFTEGDIAGITPIHEMLKAFTYPEADPTRIAGDPVCFSEPVEVEGREFDSVLLAGYSDNADALVALHGENTLVMTPCRTPLMVSGLSEAGMQQFREFAADRMPYLDIVQGPGSGGQGVPVHLGPVVIEPGASVGAQLSSGDLDMTAVGTLTWVHEDGRFLAFGHPFLADGETNLPFLTTDIIYTMPSIQRSYKLGEPLEIVGTVTQDRLTCIAGNFNETPDMVNFHLEVQDHDLDTTRRFEYQIINKEQLLAFLAYLIPMEGLTYASDRIGEGTVRVSFSIRGEGLEKPIERENLVYAGYSPSEALSEFFEAMNMLTTSNNYREVRITEVDIEVEITSARQTLDITRARYQNPPNMGPGAIGYEGPVYMEDKEEKDNLINEQTEWMYMDPEDLQNLPPAEMQGMMEEMSVLAEGSTDLYGSVLVGYNPGDTVEVLVTLRPFREDQVEQVIELEIPDDFPPGQTTIEIFGGMSSNWYGGWYDPFSGMYFYDSYTPPEDLDEVIDEFTSRDINNTLVIQLTRLAIEEDPYYYLQDNYEEPEETRAVIKMDDVIFGWYSLPIEILGENGYLEEFDEYGYEIYDEMYYEEETSGPGRNPYRN